MGKAHNFEIVRLIIRDTKMPVINKIIPYFSVPDPLIKGINLY